MAQGPELPAPRFLPASQAPRQPPLQFQRRPSRLPAPSLLSRSLLRAPQDSRAATPTRPCSGIPHPATRSKLFPHHFALHQYQVPKCSLPSCSPFRFDRGFKISRRHALVTPGFPRHAQSRRTHPAVQSGEDTTTLTLFTRVLTRICIDKKSRHTNYAGQHTRNSGQSLPSCSTRFTAAPVWNRLPPWRYISRSSIPPLSSHGENQMTKSTKLFRIAAVGIGAAALSSANLAFAQQPDNTSNNKQQTPTADQQAQ